MNVVGKTLVDRQPVIPVGRYVGNGPTVQPTILFVLFGGTPDDIESFVQRVALEQLMSASFRPLFVTDGGATWIFRRHGYLFEYVMSREQWSLHHHVESWTPFVRNRLADIMRTYHPSQVVYGPWTEPAGAPLFALSELVTASEGLHERLFALDEQVDALTKELSGLRTVARRAEKAETRLAALEKKERNRRIVKLVRTAVAENIPTGSTVLVVTKGDPELVKLSGRRGWHFPQEVNEVYAGHHPPDSAAAIAHLEILRSRGASFLVIPDPFRWWLEHYGDLASHLMTNYTLVLDDHACVIFGLGSQ